MKRAFNTPAALRLWQRSNRRRTTLTGYGFEGGVFVVHYIARAV